MLGPKMEGSDPFIDEFRTYGRKYYEAYTILMRKFEMCPVIDWFTCFGTL